MPMQTTRIYLSKCVEQSSQVSWLDFRQNSIQKQTHCKEGQT